MKSSLVLISLTVLLVAACAQQPAQPTDNNVPEQPSLPPANQAEQPSLPDPVPPKNDYPTPGEPDRTAFADFPTDVREILENAQSRAGNGLRYTYIKLVENIHSDDISSEALVFQKGSTIKMELDESQVLDYVGNREDFFDVAVLDVEQKTAQAYCLDGKACRGDTGTRKVTYDQLVFPTPMYWYDAMTDPVKTGQDTIDGRSVYNLDATVDGRVVKISVDRYSGVPVKVIDGITRYEYQKLSLGVTDPELKVS